MTGRTVPGETDCIVVGAGTAGAVVAARLAAAGVEVVLLEAGPDLGAFGDPRWPDDLLDASRLGRSHDWGYDSGDTYPQRMSFERARVIGGCSVHNGAVQTWGHRRDYDDWSAAGNPGWSTDELLPLFREATSKLRVRTYRTDELTPWQRAWYDTGPEVGLVHLTDLNDFDETTGTAPESVNIVDGVRFNTAFAYLDPVRHLPNLTIVGDTLVDTVLLESGRATGVAALRHGERLRVRSHQVVLAAGAYNTPTILQRSGVGSADLLARLGVPTVLDAPGVGANLHDQPFTLMSWAGSAEMADRMERARATGWAPDEQVMAKAASPWGAGAFDLHLLPYSPTHLSERSRWSVGVGCLQPLSRGSVTITSRDPQAAPRIDHGFLTDPEGRDAAVLAAGMLMLREMAARPRLASLVGHEIHPGPDRRGVEDLITHVRHCPDNYWHPVGTCRMGPAGDDRSVVDHRGRVHGLDGCIVSDCAIMPTIPRATTAMPAVVVGERISRFLLEERHRSTQRVRSSPGSPPALPGPRGRPRAGNSPPEHTRDPR